MSFALNLRSTRFAFVVPVLQLFLQPAVLDFQMFHYSLHLSCEKMLLRHPHLVCKMIGRRPILQKSRLYRVFLASVNNSLMLMISLSPLLSACCPVVLLWLCNRQPLTIKYPPVADFLSLSSQAQTPSRYASMLPALPDLGKKLAKPFVPVLYLTVLTNCLHDI